MIPFPPFLVAVLAPLRILGLFRADNAVVKADSTLKKADAR
jgi:hypothetical protein